MKAVDLVGQRFGRLIVIERVDNYVTPKGKKGSNWLCQCDCGNVIEVLGVNLRHGRTKSCGCLRSDKQTEKCYKHGLSETRIYNIWSKMKARCNCPTEQRYYSYGGHGIKIFEEWNNDFMSFYNWAINNGYSDDLTIDRINVDGDYEPSNCRWVNMKVQQNNRRNNVYLEYNGEIHTAAEWSKITNIKADTITSRLRKGWTIERTLTQPVRLSDAQKAEYKRKRELKRIRQECVQESDTNI